MSRGPCFFEGFVGIAWTSEVLGRQGYSTNPPDLHELTERAIHDHLASDHSQPEPFDLATGLVGIGVYALERREHASARRILSLVVRRLDETARRCAEGLTWTTSSDAQVYDLGLAHGVPGVIALLGRVCGAGLCLDVAKPLLDGALTWLRAQELGPDAAGCFARDTQPSNAKTPARLAWCYGDAGVAAALLVAGHAARMPECVALGTRVALRAASRRPSSTGVIDVSMCHGAAGLAHIFHRLYRATGERALGRAARRWFRRCLAMRDDGRFGGFSSLRAGPEDWLLQISTPGFILGSGGVAMALAAALRGLDDAWWDRCMLLSGDPADAGEPSSTPCAVGNP